MTKIKDLVTVLVDNVFASLPIDSERYDFTVRVGQEFSCRKYGTQNSSLPDRFGCFSLIADSLEETLMRNARALIAISFRPGEVHTKLDHDRAHRTHAAITRQEYRGVIRLRTEGKASARLATILWGKLHRELLLANIKHNCPNKDRRVNP